MIPMSKQITKTVQNAERQMPVTFTGGFAKWYRDYKIEKKR